MDQSLQLKVSPEKAASARRLKLSDRTISISSVAIVILVWSVITNSSLGEESSIPSPEEIAGAAYEFVVNGYQGTSFFSHIGYSIFRAMTGLFLGFVTGLPLGLLMGYYPRVAAVLNPFVSFLRPIPALAFIPLVILLMGIGETSKISVIWLAAFLYMTLYAATGVRNVPQDYLLLGQNLGLSKWRLFAHVIFPASLPYIFAGLKTATALSWAIVVAAELIAAQSGLGYMIMDAATFFNLAFVCVGIVFIGGIGLVLESATRWLESRILHWTGK